LEVFGFVRFFSAGATVTADGLLHQQQRHWNGIIVGAVAGRRPMSDVGLSTETGGISVDNLSRGRLVMASNELGNKRSITCHAGSRRSFSAGSAIAVAARVVPEVLQFCAAIEDHFPWDQHLAPLLNRL
jgi:hypothetical protein